MGLSHSLSHLSILYGLPSIPYSLSLSLTLSPMSLIVSLAPLSSLHEVSFSNLSLSGSPSLVVVRLLFLSFIALFSLCPP